MTENATPQRVKPTVERSASYPDTPIGETIAFVTTIAKNFTPQHVITRDDISAVTKIKTVHRITAAAVHYGMLERAKNGYSVSQKFRNYENPVSPEEKRNFLISFFTSPKLYADLIEKYNQHVIPTEFKSVLVRFHKIASRAAQEVANGFVENAKYVGVLNDAGILDIGNSFSPSENSSENVPEENEKHKADIAPKSENIFETFIHRHIQEPVQTQEDFKLVLTENKYCFIKYPKKLNEKDILILKKWIELLEITI